MSRYTVMFVDDEPWALESLYRVFDWQANGFSVVGRHTDPQKAWEAIRDLLPDVVFIDIRMPEIDGLEMIQRAHALRKQPLFIVVSGYSDFQYAQQALRLGVFDYCLKPVERETVAALVEKLSGMLYQREIDSNVQTLEALESGLTGEALFLGYGLSPLERCWQVAVIRYAGAETERALEAALSPLGHLTIRLGRTKLMAIVNIAEAPDASLQERLSPLASGTDAFIGISRISPRSTHLHRRIAEARSCAYSDFVDPSARVVLYHAQESERFEGSVLALEAAVLKRDLDAFSMQIQAFAASLPREGVQMHSLCRTWNRLMDAFAAGSGDQSLLCELEWGLEPESLYTFLKGTDEMCAYLRTLMAQHAGQGMPPASRGVNESFWALLRHVRENYTGKLRLSDLAAQFHLNMAYCSELFRKVVGMTYTEYVTKLRMDHACQMLKSGEAVNLQRLALELGYGDYFTFSKRFKQYFGKPPSQLQAMDVREDSR